MSMELACFYGIFAIIFFFLQRIFFNKAKHILIKALPISLSMLSFLLCLSIYLIKLYLIKSKNHYIAEGSRTLVGFRGEFSPLPSLHSLVILYVFQATKGYLDQKGLFSAAIVRFPSAIKEII